MVRVNRKQLNKDAQTRYKEGLEWPWWKKLLRGWYILKYLLDRGIV